jgi:hypothetical protein
LYLFFTPLHPVSEVKCLIKANQRRQTSKHANMAQETTTILRNKRRQSELQKNQNLLQRNTTDPAAKNQSVKEKTKIGCKKRRQQASIKNESLLSKRTMYKKI